MSKLLLTGVFLLASKYLLSQTLETKIASTSAQIASLKAAHDSLSGALEELKFQSMRHQITQVGLRFYFKGVKYEGIGESNTEVRAAFIELVDGVVPFSKTTVSSAIKKAIQECISKMP